MNNGKGDCGCGGKKLDTPQRLAEIQAQPQARPTERRAQRMNYECLRHVRIQGVGRVIG